MIPRLKKTLKQEIQPALKDQFGFKNLFMVPTIEKVVLNMGLGLDGTDKKLMAAAENIMNIISGQKCMKTLARKSVASFKIREKMPLGLKCTLRKNRMFQFLDVLRNSALPALRDFRGISLKSFDGRGNYTFGVKDLSIFPGVDFELLADKPRGIDVTITTTAKNDEEAKVLLTSLGLPFKKK